MAAPVLKIVHLIMEGSPNCHVPRAAINSSAIVRRRRNVSHGVATVSVMTPDERFDRLVDECLGIDGVTPPSSGGGFGAGALRYRKKIFAMLVRGHLVVKLPRARVDELIASGDGVRFDANRGKPMKEWIAMDPGSDLSWSMLAKEALEFAAGR